MTLCRCLGLDILIGVLWNMVWLHSIINAGVTVLAVVVVARPRAYPGIYRKPRCPFCGPVVHSDAHNDDIFLMS